MFASFSANLPEEWRRLTPDEAFSLRDRLPYAVRRPVPGQYDVLGDIDTWLASGFDGQALTVTSQTGEIPIEQASIDQIREHWKGGSNEGPRRRFVDGEVTTIGKDAHPAIRCSMQTDAEPPSFGPSTSTDYYVPTHGQLLILAFHSWEDSVGRANPVMGPIVESASFPRPPKGIEDLGDRIGRALFVGALVGLGLVALRMLRKRPSPPGSPGAPSPES